MTSDIGAGASARREYERRRAARAARVRAKHPRIGGLLLAAFEEPQSTRAWATGALGEQRLAGILAGLRGVRLLHDRRVPGSRANIDHLVIGPAGVFVIDAKRYSGRPHKQVRGGVLGPAVEALLVGRRDCSKLATGVHRHTALVEAALHAANRPEPVSGMLCFVDADWPMFGRGFRFADLDVVSPRRAAKILARPGRMSDDRASAVWHVLDAHFRPA